MKSHDSRKGSQYKFLTTDYEDPKMEKILDKDKENSFPQQSTIKMETKEK